MATFIPAHGEPRYVAPPDGRTAFTLAELQKYVGGYLESVATGLILTPDGRPVVLFVNEDGKREPYTVNAFATALVRAYLGPDDVIAGDAILCTLAEAGEGEGDTAAPSPREALIREARQQGLNVDHLKSAGAPEDAHQCWFCHAPLRYSSMRCPKCGEANG